MNKIVLSCIFLFSFNLSAHGQELQIISPESFLAENPSPDSQAIIDFAIHQFDQQRGQSITQTNLDQLWNDVDARNHLGLARFQIINQRLYVDSSNLKVFKFEVLQSFLQKLLLTYKINDCDFILYLKDRIDTGLPISTSLAKKHLNIPAFLISKDTQDPLEQKKFLLPDAYMLTGWFSGYKTRLEQNSSNFLWQDKINKYFWRGSTTGAFQNGIYYDVAYNIKLFDKIPRLSLVILSKLYPELIDARFVNDDSITPNQDGENLKMILSLLFGTEPTKYMTDIVDHLKYKYLISLDGNTCAWLRVPWIMSSNSVLVKQETSKIEWFYPALKAYVNYIPVNTRLTNIFSQMQWMEQHDAQVKQISLNAQNFIKNNLMQEHIEAHMAIILNEYAKLHQNNKIIASLPTTEEIADKQKLLDYQKLTLLEKTIYRYNQLSAYIKKVKKNFKNYFTKA